MTLGMLPRTKSVEGGVGLTLLYTLWEEAEKLEIFHDFSIRALTNYLWSVPLQSGQQMAIFKEKVM